MAKYQIKTDKGTYEIDVKESPLGPPQGYIPSQDPAASGMVQEVPGPITDALLMGVGGLSGPVVKTAPTAVAKVTGGALKGAGEAVAKAGKVAFAPLKKTSEAAINAAEKSVGIVNKAVDTKIMAKDLGIEKGAQSMANVFNTMEAKLTAKENLSPQTLKNFINYTSNVMKEKLKPGSPNYAKASETISLARKALNKQIPARSKPAADLANAYTRINALKSTAKVAGIAGLSGGALATALKYLGGH